jgi:hypothetical protein
MLRQWSNQIPHVQRCIDRVSQIREFRCRPTCSVIGVPNGINTLLHFLHFARFRGWQRVLLSTRFP